VKLITTEMALSDAPYFNMEAADIASNNTGLKLEVLVRLVEPYSYHRYLVSIHVCIPSCIIATQK